MKRKVFISYCHKDTTEEWIGKLITTLGEHEIDSIVDIYDLQLGQDLNYFMEQMKNADKVLILLGKEYKERANDRKAGVGTETQIISNDVYKDVEQTKFIPIVIGKDKHGNAYLPYYLESRFYIDFSDTSLFNKNIKMLIRQIYDQPMRDKLEVSVKKSKRNLFLMLISLFIFIVIGANNLKKNVEKVEKHSEYLNQYVFGKYDGLRMGTVISTANHLTDVIFYLNKDEEEKGNYIRVLQYWVDYDFSNQRADEFVDEYESILIGFCEKYNNLELKLGDKDRNDSWEFLEETGVFIDTPFWSGEINYRNTLVYEYSDGIIIEKCLYFGEDYIIVIIWSSCEKSFNDMLNTKNSNLMLNCFNSFKQVYKS